MKLAHILVTVFSVAYLEPVAAQTPINYGSTSLFNVQFNKHGACVAIRKISVRTNESSRRRSGAFAFGVLEVDGNEIAMVSFMNPKWEMKKGQTGKGHLSIDGDRYQTVFWADGNNMLSAALKLDNLKKIAFGRKLTIDTGVEIYSLPLTGTAKALPLIIRCYKDHFANRTNPLDNDRRSSGFDARSTNPLGQKY